MRRLALLFLFGYKRCISPFLPITCRFYPSCSEYTRQAISKYGVGRGVWMGIRRLLRCHPLHVGGFDPVP
jgi:uncharacterized protein